MNIDVKKIQKELLGWYDANARSLPWRDNPTPYRVWISEIMLQQTRVDTVKPYFDRFVSELPTVRDLAEADEQQLLKLWEGLGYYSRARNLKKAAAEILEKYAGRLPAAADKLVKLPGIGPYSAGAIASIAFGIRTPAVDGNVHRVIAQITANRGDLTEKEVKEQIEKVVWDLLPDKRVGDFNQSLMELGAIVCLPNGVPRCDACPVKAFCSAFAEGVVDQIPLKTAKAVRKIFDKTVLVIRFGQKTAIRKRADEGVLKGLWEFPNMDGRLSPDECRKVLDSWSIRVDQLESLPKAKHVFTHMEWHMTGYLAIVGECVGERSPDSNTMQSGGKSSRQPADECGAGCFQLPAGECMADVRTPLQESGLVWATSDELRLQYALPSAFKAYLAYVPGASASPSSVPTPSRREKAVSDT